MGLPLPAVDGNVARVLARHAAEPLIVSRGRDRRRLEARALGLQSRDRPGDFNEALMELGATICTPRSPTCLSCPIADDCRARSEGRVHELPPRAARPPMRDVRAAAAVVLRQGRVLLARRAEDESIMPGLWELPGGWTDLEAGAFLESEVLPALGGGRVVERLGTVRHVVTTRRICVEILRCELARPAPRRAGLAWREPADVELALTGATRRALPLVAAVVHGTAR
jgi:A/G-specific adenine glycosylase